MPGVKVKSPFSKAQQQPGKCMKTDLCQGLSLKFQNPGYKREKESYTKTLRTQNGFRFF